MICENNFRKVLHCRCLGWFWIWLGFWICQHSEYTGFLNILGLWICQGSGYTTILNIPGLHRVVNMPEYAWIIPGYVWVCLNIPKSVWITFVLHLPFVIPYLKGEPWLFSWRVKNWIFYSCCKYLIVFFVLDWIFLQVRFRICCYLWEPRESGAVNLDIPNQ